MILETITRMKAAKTSTKMLIRSERQSIQGTISFLVMETDVEDWLCCDW